MFRMMKPCTESIFSKFSREKTFGGWEFHWVGKSYIARMIHLGDHTCFAENQKWTHSYWIATTFPDIPLLFTSREPCTPLLVVHSSEQDWLGTMCERSKVKIFLLCHDLHGAIRRLREIFVLVSWFNGPLATTTKSGYGNLVRYSSVKTIFQQKNSGAQDENWDEPVDATG